LFGLHCAGGHQYAPSFEGLVGVVERELGQQVESGDLFLFFNRRGDRVKVLWFAGDGLVIWYKRLEGGTFEVPKAARTVREDGSASPAGIEMRVSDLTLILEGIDLASVRHRPRWRRA
jgi:transposase